MKNIQKNILTILSILMLGGIAQAQVIGGNKGGGTEVETDAKAAFDAQVQKNREDARAALKPYKYDGTKTTTFAYRTYSYAKEVEILTVENTDYMFSFNATSVTKEKITVRIYDKPETSPGRILLFENTNVSSNNFTVKLDDLNAKFRAERAKSIGDEAAAKLRLKKVYVSYVIPAVDKEVQTEQVAKNKTVTTNVVTFNAIVVAVGYQNI
jgi:hypothetical protein